jgi:signal transduction histidine kinase/CheY-like chemotaxis protein
MIRLAAYSISAAVSLWVAAFAYYGLRKERGRPFAFLCGVVFLWNLSFIFLQVIPGGQPSESNFPARLFINLSHLSYSLLLPLLYVFSRGDGFRGLRRIRLMAILGVPAVANVFVWLYPEGRDGIHPLIRAVFIIQVVFGVFLGILSIRVLYKRSKNPSDHERTSVARVLIGAFLFTVVFALYKAGAFLEPSMDPSPVAVSAALVIVAAGYRRLDPFTAVAENEDRLRRFEFIADASQEYMSIINREYRYEAVNKAFCAAMNRTPEQVVGRTVESIWDPDAFRERILPPLRDCLSGRALRFRSNFSFGGAKPRSLEVSYYPFIPPGASAPTHAVVITKDISAYVQKEEELDAARRQADAANRAKSDFLAAMSHEIRTPINAVMGLTELALRRRELEPELRDDLETVKAASVNLLALVNDILDLSKIEAGGMRLERIPFSPRDSIERTVKSFRPAVERKGIKLETDIDPKLPPFVSGDPLRFSQILFNLIGNAVKFTERGGIVVTLFVAPRPDLPDKVCLRVEVRDTGIGIPEDRQSAIFDSFSQASEGTSRKYGGSGLGLSISRRLARLLGGDVTVESILGSGSSFTFDSCFDAAPESSVAENVIVELPVAVCDTQPSESRPEGGSILLVEDNPINARVALRFLESIGRPAERAEGGVEAIGMLRSKPYEVVLMDVEMPGMDGLETTRRVRSGEAGEVARSVPVIAMTAHSGSDIRERCSEAGMDDFLSKPLEFTELEAVLSRFDRTQSYKIPGQRNAALGIMSPTQTSGLEIPLLDRKATLVRLGGDEDLLRELYGILRDEAGERTAAALRYSEAADYEALAALAHQVKGSAASLGALRLSAAAGALHKAAADGDGPKIAGTLESFLRVYADTYKELEV